jgi:hypothetical protein
MDQLTIPFQRTVIGLAGAELPEESVTNRVKYQTGKLRRLIDPWFDIMSVLYKSAVFHHRGKV